jgi:hypothetical protein
MAGESTIKSLTPNYELHSRADIPDDYHCTCDLCTKNFLGEIYHTPTDQYYTNYTRNSYYFPDEKPPGGFDKHICPGHWSGYRWAIQNLTEPGDTVFDPTVGTGTAIVEAINNGRNGVGIELEFAEITKRTVQVQIERGTAKGDSHVIEGDARELDLLLNDNGHIGNGVFNLIVNGTPYPVLGGGQSDAPERGYTSKGRGASITYQKDKSVGILKGKEYWKTIGCIYSKAIDKLKPGGKFVTIIKDPTQNKEAYLLHKMIAEYMMESAPLKYYGTFIHKHLPSTLFMNTYPKRYPEVKIPLYQTGTVLEKY